MSDRTQAYLAFFLADARTRVDRIVALYESLPGLRTVKQEKRWDVCNALWIRHSHRQRRRPPEVKG